MATPDVGLSLDTGRGEAGDAYGLVTIVPPAPAARAKVRPRDLTVLLDTARGEEARVLFDQLAEDDFSMFPKDNEWLFALTLLAEAASILDDRDRALVLYEQLRPYEDLVALAASEVSVGPVSLTLGILAAQLGHQEEAAAAYREAMDAGALTGSDGARRLA